MLPQGEEATGSWDQCEEPFSSWGNQEPEQNLGWEKQP